ncbi:acyl-[acyl-carrier-protein]-phospholipid O-acyltransferase/long-chain-fatty-acid--[acyl-carrier-protein] ligase [Azospirillum agricola]|uniref:acyl-[ACP]--phospholipid O-acyltransferase n=1 Tax=Azospirillum agricola TaxID=1720247 RepID=UPI001AE5596C|nr:acyl-[ACP]--phospholipid O-acyltransferase [Azospirillum agricola]MBP2228712.1 acyl-[acyl-carrier-protein]-phospholipid O-acyltransferase/long-chain-fatty-acid--[acyl-carrier-protein] ligase [Azospirillum agricola]
MSAPALLASRRFLPLFLTQFLGAFGDNVLRGAIAVIAVYGLAAGGSPDGMSNGAMISTLAAGAFTLPFLLLSATAGQLADRHDRTLVARAVKLAEIGLMGVASWGIVAADLPVLIIALVGMGAHSTMFGPVKYGLLPDLLAPSELTAANGLVEAGTFVAILLGTIAGGSLALVHPWAVPGLLGASAVLGLGASLFIPRAGNADPAVRVGLNPLSVTVRVLRSVAGDRVSMRAIHGISVFWGVGAVVMAQFPSIARETLGADANGATLLLAVFAIGVAAGSILAGLSHRAPSTADAGKAALAGLVAALAGAALPLLTPAVPPAEPLSPMALLAQPWALPLLADLFVIAAAGGAFAVPLYALIQHRAKPSVRARVIAAANVVNALYMVAGSAVAAGMLALGLSPLAVAAWGGASMLAAVVMALAVDGRGLLRAVFRAVFRLAFRVEVRGAEHLTTLQGAAVVTPNHQSFLDGALLAAFLPGMRFAVDTHIARLALVRPFLAMADHVTIDPTNPLGTRALARALADGDKVCVFPEGRITVTGSLMKINGGPGMLADKARCPVVPVCIEGAQRSILSRMRGRLRLGLFPRITITVMPPAPTPDVSGLVGKTRRAALKSWLSRLMTETVCAARAQPDTLMLALLDARRKTGAREAAVQDGDFTTVSYRALAARALVLGRILTRGTEPGEAVGVLLPTASPTAAVFFGLAAHGRPAAMLNFTAGPDSVKAACRAAGVRRIVTSAQFVEKARLGALVEALAADHAIIHLEEVKRGLTLGDTLRALVALVMPDRLLPEQGTPDDVAAILFTSGSEGPPKGVALSHGNLLANLTQVASVVDFTRRDVVFNCLPVFHSFGLTGGMLLPILNGVKTVLYPNPRHVRLIPELVYQTNATVLFGTDFFLSAWARTADPYDYRSLRLVFAGAERLQDETRRVYTERLRVHLLEGYGTTETAPVIAVNTPARFRPGSVGQALPGIETELVPVPGVETGGRLRVRGPNVMKGYLHADRPGVIQPPEGGWHDTGDIVTIDAEGFIRIVGRVKRFAKVAGEMIALGVVEEIAGLADAGAAHAAVALPDARRGERIVLVTTSAALTRDALAAAARGRGAPEIAVPRDVLRLDAIPLLGTGKTDYPAVARFAAEAAKETA